MIQAAKVQTTQKVNECFGVGVISEAKDGAAPALNPGWVHRRINTYPEARHAQLVQYLCSITEKFIRLMHLMIHLAKMQTTQKVNECFGVGVTSEAKDGAAPALNPGRVHRRTSTYPEARHAYDMHHDFN